MRISTHTFPTLLLLLVRIKIDSTEHVSVSLGGNDIVLCLLMILPIGIVSK